MNHTYRQPKTYIYTGFSYRYQCWLIKQIVQDCGHLDNAQCECYGRTHKGEKLITED